MGRYTVALSFAVALILAAVPGKAYGAPSGEKVTPEVEYSYYAIGGAEWDGRSGSFAYLGTGAERPIDERYSLNGKLFYGDLEYKFGSLGKELTAEVEILTVLGGISFKKDRYVLGAGAGVDIRKTERELGAGSTETDNETGLSLQVEANFWGDNKLTLSGIASYSSIDDFFWARARSKKGVYEAAGKTDLNLGVELIGMGNSDFSSIQGGVIAELYKNPSKLSVLVKVGLKKSSELASTGYAGIELYKGF